MDALVVLNEHGNLSITNLMHYSKLSGEDNVLVVRELLKRGLIEFFKSTRERKKLQLTDAGRIIKQSGKHSSSPPSPAAPGDEQVKSIV